MNARRAPPITDHQRRSFGGARQRILAARQYVVMLDFSELATDGTDFELLARELLFELGYRPHWTGVGTDRGRDLLVEEPGDPLFGRKPRRWLVQCKHGANGGRDVGRSALEDIKGVCDEHQANGFLLICSTKPTSTLVTHLREIEEGDQHLKTHIWDAVTLERLFSTPRTWPIAQRFLPLSASDWRIWASELPNRFLANYKGHFFHLTNRIGAGADHHLASLSSGVADLGALSLPADHELRVRAVHYDDKHNDYRWYVDDLYEDAASVTPADLCDRLGEGVATSDGSTHYWDILLRNVGRSRDHYDRDHYDYYEPYLEAFLFGLPRSMRPS